MIDSERRERGIPIPARGNGVTSLPGHPPRFLRVLYEGGPWEREAFDWNVCLKREAFDWNVCLKGLIAPGSEKKSPGDRRGTEGYKTPSSER